MGATTYTLELPFPALPRATWAIAADTAAANAAAGLDPYDYRDEALPDGTSRRSFTTSANGLTLVGEELVSRWEAPRTFAIERLYSRGPFVRSLHRCWVTPGNDGSLMRHEYTMEPRGVLGKVWVWGFGREILPAFQRYYEGRAAQLRSGALTELPLDAWEPVERWKPKPEQIRRVGELVTRTRAYLDSPAVEQIGDWILQCPEQELRRMRPKALAKSWGFDQQETVDAFLATTKLGLTRLRWDVICPHCRGDKGLLAELDDVRRDARCDACNIDFEVDLSRSLEAAFAPHPQVREVPQERYCLGGPSLTPHIEAQTLLEAGASDDPTLLLPAGRYRLRVTGCDGFRWIVAGEGEQVEWDVAVAADGLQGDDAAVPGDTPVTLTLHNRTDRRVIAVVESAAWADDALAAGELIADQRFRDLFSDQMLARGVSLAIEEVTIVFTDLVGSTAMYGALGDAAAFGLVWSHFEVLTEIVRETGGATVKTIGDAVMAAFVRPEDALRATHALHERVAAYVGEQGHEHPVSLKVGLHTGPCIVVTLNERLDYFGQTVNAAARVQGLSDGDDIVVSAATAQRTDGCAVLREQGWRVQQFDQSVKGIDQPLSLLRFERDGLVPPDGLAALDGVETLDEEL